MKESDITTLVKAFEKKALDGPKNKVPEWFLKDIQQRDEDEIEMKFSLGDKYAKKLFIALARKHGFKPYRYPKQKHTTVVLYGKKSYMDHVLWPEFTELCEELDFFLDHMTNELVRNVLHEDVSDIPYATENN